MINCSVAQVRFYVIIIVLPFSSVFSSEMALTRVFRNEARSKTLFQAHGLYLVKTSAALGLQASTYVPGHSP